MVDQNIIISLSELSYQLKKPNVESYLLRLHLSTSFSVDQPTSFSLHARVRITWSRAVTWACAVTWQPLTRFSQPMRMEICNHVHGVKSRGSGDCKKLSPLASANGKWFVSPYRLLGQNQQCKIFVFIKRGISKDFVSIQFITSVSSGSNANRFHFESCFQPPSFLNNHQFSLYPVGFGRTNLLSKVSSSFRTVFSVT